MLHYFVLECPGNGEIGDCECEGQLWINADCRSYTNWKSSQTLQGLILLYFYPREGFYCDSKLAGGGKDIKCSEGERIEVNMVDKTWKCIMVRQ